VQRQGGFTLLEILIALSIVSILAVVAVPLYLDYRVRAQISEGFVMAETVKDMVLEYHASTGNWPASNAAAALEVPSYYKTEYIDNIAVTANAAGVFITMTYSIPALGANNTIILTSSAAGGDVITWSCLRGSVIQRFRPAACRS